VNPISQCPTSPRVRAILFFSVRLRPAVSLLTFNDSQDLFVCYRTVCKKWCTAFDSALPLSELRLRIASALDLICKDFVPQPIFHRWSDPGPPRETSIRNVASRLTFLESRGPWNPGSDPATPVLLEILYAYLEPREHQRKLETVLRNAAMARAHFGQSLGNKLHSSASEILRRLRFDVVQATEGFRFLLGCSGFCTRAIITIDLGNEEPALVLAIAATFEIGPREDTLDLCVIPCRPFRSHAHSYSPSIPRNYQFDVMSPSHREMMQPLVTDPVEPRSMEGVEESFRVFSLCAGRRFASRLYDEKSLLKLLSLLPDVRQQQSGFFKTTAHRICL
jgi:hypothetical protein